MSSARDGRRRASALSVSLLAHGLALYAALVLVQRSIPPVPLPDATVALEFVQAPAAASSPAAPPASEPAAADTPPPSAEPQTAATEPRIDQALLLPAPTPPPDITEQRAPAPSEQPAMTAEPKVEPPPAPPSAASAAPRPAQPTKPHVGVARHLPSKSAATTSVAAAAAIALVLPARPVAGMESDRPPVYPEAARRRGEQGRVVLQVDVSAQGTPVGVSVAQSSGFASLDEAALRAVEQWRFVPATRGGTPIAAVAEVPVHFRLTN